MPLPTSGFSPSGPLPFDTVPLTRAEVDVEALDANVRAFSHWIKPARLLAVIKANAYGHGSVMSARVALNAGAEHLAVYTVDEALILREAGISAPILVFGPFSALQAVQIVEHHLTPTVSSLETATLLDSASAGRSLDVHVKMDTGLERAGIAAGDILPFMHRLSAFPSLRYQGIYTHFACADESDPAPTHRQFETFNQAVQTLERAGYSFALKHVANSAATLNFRSMHLDMVRVGISLYGYYPSSDVQRSVALRPALSLVSQITRVHNISAGTGVGYGYEFRSCRPSTIALAPIGYGDGLPRALGNSAGRVIVRGRFAPIVGRVSMDQITIDVTDVWGVCAGDPVTLIGAQGEVKQSAEDLGAQSCTISYDILTGLLPRVPRLYVRAGQVIGMQSLIDNTIPSDTMADR